MAWTAIVDIAAVLAFIYLVMAVIGSSLVELGATILGWRAGTLKDGIGKLLDDPDLRSLAARVYGHPLMVQPGGGRGPSYIDPKLFAMVLTDVVGQNGGFAGVSVKAPVAALLRATGNDPEAFKAAAEQWFDGAMERLSGVYKRQTQMVLFVFSLLAAGLCNVDSIQLTRGLATMSTKDRGALVDMVAKTEQAAAEPAAPDGTGKSIKASMDALDKFTNLIPYDKPQSALGWVGKLVGWMMTALAASLGSHFWFNLLQNALRLSGRKPAVATEGA
ncbi:hypothetical protein [Magnetospirillum sp. 15-1]|uniref:hypothetical protein n=1 Tax=Magnetospirillum sp. 15-1 TaxID=1979370 RepID=UPI000BBCA5BC|nr:hypothetical protein [Magnetospirillum sp. 15-1]